MKARTYEVVKVYGAVSLLVRSFAFSFPDRSLSVSLLWLDPRVEGTYFPADIPLLRYWKNQKSLSLHVLILRFSSLPQFLPKYNLLASHISSYCMHSITSCHKKTSSINSVCIKRDADLYAKRQHFDDFLTCKVQRWQLENYVAHFKIGSRFHP